MKKAVQTIAVIAILILSLVAICGCSKNSSNIPENIEDIPEEVTIIIDDSEAAGGF